MIKMLQVNIEEAKVRLTDLIDEAHQGETVIIKVNDNRSVLLMPISSGKGRQAGTAKGLITMSDDFDEPLEDFKEYIE